MRMLLLENKDFREFIELLNSRGVRCLVVGGDAGYPRFTGDLDIWIAADSENASLFAGAVKDFGFGELKLVRNDNAADEGHTFFRHRRDPGGPGSGCGDSSARERDRP